MKLSYPAQADAAAPFACASASWRNRLRKLLPALILAGSRAGAVAVQVAVQVLVGALTGASGLGVLQLFTSWSCMAGEFLAQGLPARAMRSVAVDFARGDAQAVRSILGSSATRIVRAWLPLAALVSASIVVGYGTLQTDGSGSYVLVALVVVLAAPLFALLRLGADALKGADAPLAAVSLENLGPPVIILIACSICWVSGREVQVVTLLIAGIAGFALPPLGLWAALRRQLNACAAAVEDIATSQPRVHHDLRSLWAISVLSIAFLHLPFLLLPLYADVAQVGVYAVAHKLINVSTTLLLLQAAVFGPAFARAAAAADGIALQRLLRRTQLISTMIYLPTASGLLLASDPLAVLFNLEPSALRPYLLILAAGHLINAATGLSGVLLNMAGAAAIELRALARATLFTILLTPLVGPAHGALGLACVFSGTVAIKNLLSYIAARRYLQQREFLS